MISFRSKSFTSRIETIVPKRRPRPNEQIDPAPVRVWVYRMKRRLRLQLTICVTLLVVAATGCSKSYKPELSAASPQPSASPSQPIASSPAPTENPDAGAFACTLLTKEEIQGVQGEPFNAAKASQKSSGGLAISQCYFELPTTVNSIVLTVTQKASGADGRDPKENWQEIFHTAKPEKEGKAEHKPEKIEGVGDEAFWTGTRVGGALYVLKGNTFIRVSVGGGGDRPEKIEKSKALAQNILKRL